MKHKITSVVSLSLAGLGYLHQEFMTVGYWNWFDLYGLHHEPLIISSALIGLFLLVWGHYHV